MPARRPTPPSTETRAPTPSGTPRRWWAVWTCPTSNAVGLGNLHGNIEGVPAADSPTMAYGKLTEASAGKDSTTGHWEIAGIITTEPQATFTETGFPDELVEAVEKEAGCEFIGNYAASGTVILEELGEEHMQDRQADPLHVGRLRISDRRPQGRDPARGALPDLSDRSQAL